MAVNANKNFGTGGGATTVGFSIPLTVSDLDRMVLLEFSVVGGVADDYIGLKALNKVNAGLYQVPIGKVLYMLSANTAPSTMLVGYADTALGADRTATPPTNPVYLAAAATSYSSGRLTASLQTNWASAIKIPAGKYPFWRTGVTGGATHQFACILLDE